MSVLSQIIEYKKEHVRFCKKKRPEEELKNSLKGVSRKSNFLQALKLADKPAIIAEVKKASPSKGIIREDLDPLKCASDYIAAGASCLSVLTDEKFFKGQLSYLSQIRANFSEIPVLRKDFIIDKYQVYETKEVGADALLLIVAALEFETLQQLFLEAVDIGLDVLVEVHDEAELESALELVKLEKSFAIGINNRNLKTFETTLDVTKNLAPIIISKTSEDSRPLLVSESGIFSASDLLALAKNQIDAFLIGESLVSEGDPKDNLSKLIREYRDNG